MVSSGMVLLVLLIGMGAFLAYENTLPTTVKANVKDGQKDLPTDSTFVMRFSRSISIEAVKRAFSVTPVTDGSISAISGQTDYAWTPNKPLAELTSYTVSFKATSDTTHHHVNAGQWTFTTIIIPRVTAITAADGTPLKDGLEMDPSASMKLTFNDVMEPVTIKLTINGQPVTVKWAADDKSLTFSTAGLASGPLTVSIAPGGRDQTGHLVPGSFTLHTGIYWHDHEHTISLNYPALIQIPNDEFARDQNGLQAADIVYEYLAEGGITRLTAIFQRAPDVIGPMRSARFISLKLGRHYRGLLFQSGESQATAARAASDPTPQFFDTIGYQYRTGARDAPDNLMINGDRVLAAEQLFNIQTWSFPKQRPNITGGTAVGPVGVDEHYSVYTYDAATGTYLKSEEGHAYSDASLHAPLRIEMLITLHTQEQLLNVGDGHGAHIHDFNLDTSGRVEIYYKGLQYTGTWSSPDSHGPLVFTLDNGQVVSLPPGLVWIDVVQ
ncbi:MAG TPA: DUF3048 domain-containing protein [Candidatus Dormibacteraeota bacterium]|nr:DUF3048 domain-containing protein [Candidatus Dormibacteraeota bacterium]